jgi:hypothetical protein
MSAHEDRMMHMKIIAGAVAALVALGGAPTVALAKDQGARPPAAKRACFFTRNVNGFAAPDDRTLYVRVGVRDVYKFDMFGSCPDIDWNQSLALVSRPSSSICSGMDAEVISHSAIGPQRCPVRNVQKLTAEEVKALPKRARP